MAYLRSLPLCDSAGCTKRATEEVITFRDEVHSWRCAKHAAKALADVQAAEEKYHAAWAAAHPGRS